MLSELNEQRLGRLGYRVQAFTSSTEALARFRKNPGDFDLVITDLTMPSMTGIDLAGAILKIRPDMPIILCTGLAEQEVHDRAEAMGVRGFLSKPLSVRDLALTVRQVLDQRK